MADNTSFLPEDYLARKIARRTNAICLSLFGVVMVGVVAAFFVTDRQRAEVRAQQAQVSTSYAEAAKRIEEYENLQVRKHDMIRKARIISVLVERVPRSLVMAELINHMPPALSLTEFELDTEIIRAAARPKTAIERQREKMNQKTELEEKNTPEAPPTAIKLKLVGVAPTDVEVSTFISRLNHHPMFDEVVLAFSEQTTIEQQPMRKFRIEMDLIQEVDVTGLEPTKVSRKLANNPMSDKFQIDENGNLVKPEDQPTQVGAVETE